MGGLKGCLKESDVEGSLKRSFKVTTLRASLKKGLKGSDLKGGPLFWCLVRTRGA